MIGVRHSGTKFILEVDNLDFASLLPYYVIGVRLLGNCTHSQMTPTEQGAGINTHYLRNSTHRQNLCFHFANHPSTTAYKQAVLASLVHDHCLTMVGAFSNTVICTYTLL
jgi:hypothetical protein